MWQRWGNKTPTISHPMQFTQLDQDYGYDERYLETIVEVDSISSRRQSALVALPELPFRAVPPMSDIPQPVNIQQPHSPTTSVSRDHGLRINVRVPKQDSAEEEVSPLTPCGEHTPQNEPPISPIEPETRTIPRVPKPDRAFQSQIPRKKLPASPASATQQTKWDDYSGEPTSDERGKPSTVRPGTQPVELQYPHLKERTKMILAGLREREAAKSQPWGKVPPPVADDPLDQPVTREPWKGASGRSAIVEPVRNTPSNRQGPLQFPKRKDSRPQASLPPAEPPKPVVAESDSPQLRSVPSEEEIKPIVPLKSAKRIRTPELVTKITTQSPEIQSPMSPDLIIPHQTIPEVSQPRAESPPYEEEPKTPTSPVPIDDLHIVEKPETSPTYGSPELDREQSRFSWTTYTTSTAESPRSMAQTTQDFSTPPPIPNLPPLITIKKRPVSSSPFLHSAPYSRQSFADSNASVVRKPLPGSSARSPSISSATSRAMSTSKSLPPTPTILEAADKIENLDAQLEALSRRKRNITRIVSDLEASLRKNAVVYDMWKRREVEKNITNHKLELDDVGREIHEISIQLHRAQRKRDREDGYEACTGLWIKRVTS